MSACCYVRRVRSVYYIDPDLFQVKSNCLLFYYIDLDLFQIDFSASCVFRGVLKELGSERSVYYYINSDLFQDIISQIASFSTI